MQTTINLRLPTGLKKEFDAICEEKYLNGSEQIRDMIKSFIEMNQPPEELANEVVTRQEAETYLNLSSIEFQHYLRSLNIKPHNSYGRDKKLIQLFWKKDISILRRDWNE